MRSIVCAALLLTMPVQAGAQEAGRPDARGDTMMTGSTSPDVHLAECAMSQQSGEAVLSARIVGAGPGGGPRVLATSPGSSGDLDGDGVDFSWSATDSGIVPTVTFNAIKTKGAGGVDRVGSQACAAPSSQRLLLPVVQKRTGRPVATCDVSGDPAMPVFTVSIPLSAFGSGTKTGHVSLIKRSANPGGGGPIVRCDWSSVAKGTSLIATYDLKLAKKV